MLDLVGVDQVGVRDLHQAHVAGDLEVTLHRAAHDAELAPVRESRLSDLSDTGEVGGEGRDDDAAHRPREDIVDTVLDVPLGGGVALTLGVGRIGHQQVDALVAEAGEQRHVEVVVDRGQVNLEVAGGGQGALRGGHVDAEGVGDGVGDVEELGAEAAAADVGVLIDLDDAGGGGQVVLLQLVADQRAGQAGRIDDGHLDGLEQEGDRADVVLVAVGDEQGADLALVLLQVGEVGDDVVHAGGGVVGEHDAAVEDDQIGVVLDAVAVLADLAQAAQGIDLDRGIIHIPDRGRLSLPLDGVIHDYFLLESMHKKCAEPNSSTLYIVCQRVQNNKTTIIFEGDYISLTTAGSSRQGFAASIRS